MNRNNTPPPNRDPRRDPRRNGNARPHDPRDRRDPRDPRYRDPRNAARPRQAPQQGRSNVPPRNGYPPQGGGYGGYGVPNDRRATQDAEYMQYLQRKRELERRQAEARRMAERDRERRERQRRKAEAERRFRRNMKILGGRLLVFAVVLLVMCLLAGLLFLLFFNQTPDKPDTSGKMTYYYGGSEQRQVSMETAVSSANGVVYICFNDLAAYLGMSESGTAEEMRFILPSPGGDLPSDSSGVGTEESIVFDVDSINVTINGQNAQLDLPSVLHGTEVWVSSDIVTEYMNDLSFRYEEKRSQIYISRILDEENSDEENDIYVYLPVSFKLKSSSSLPPIPEDMVGGVSPQT